MKRLTVIILLLVAAAGFAASAAPDTQPLIQPQDLQYVGAFRLPSGATEQTSFSYGGTALAYNAGNDSLFIVGHDVHQRVAEISIPQVVNSSSLSALPTATLRQNFADVLEGRGSQIGSGSDVKIGGMLVNGNSLIISAFLYYDGSGSQTLSHFKSGLNLATTGDVQGPYRLGSAGAGYVSGYMTPIPPEWLSLFGSPALTGNCCLSIIGRTSSGPAVSAFNPAHVASQNPVPATELLGYPLEHSLAPFDSKNALFNGTTKMGGVAFPKGTRSVLFVGRHGTGPYCYGTVSECPDPAQTEKGNHAYPYVYQVWAYNALDLLAVKNGTKQRWAVTPYRTWNLQVPFSDDNHWVGGVAYDPAGNRIFVSTMYSDGTRPVVHVFNVTVGGGSTTVPAPPTNLRLSQ
jgi:hypothetical protein